MQFFNKTLKRFAHKKSTKLSFLLFLTVLLSSHDLFIKMDSYFVKPNEIAVLSLFNGTFEKSENLISRDRIIDASFVAEGKRLPIDSELWVDQDSTITQLAFNTGVAGTKVVGVSTKARNIELSADKFNDYLKHDGVLDILKDRTENNRLGEDAIESYEKHVKAIYQVGDQKTDDWTAKLGYPIEFVPQENPYDKHTGEELKVQLLLDGKPLPNQLVYANSIAGSHHHHHDDHTHNHDHDHSHEKNSHTHIEGQQLRTDIKGFVQVKLPNDGLYYLRTIYMEKVENNENLTHRSKWATLSFEVTHSHKEHMHSDEIPIWIFIVGSFLVIALLFFVFRKKN